MNHWTHAVCTDTMPYTRQLQWSCTFCQVQVIVQYHWVIWSGKCTIILWVACLSGSGDCTNGCNTLVMTTVGWVCLKMLSRVEVLEDVSEYYMIMQMLSVELLCGPSLTIDAANNLGPPLCTDSKRKVDRHNSQQ